MIGRSTVMINHPLKLGFTIDVSLIQVEFPDLQLLVKGQRQSQACFDISLQLESGFISGLA
jgi:hypothetical protein